MFGILIFACNSGELTAFPSSLNWGEIDFQSTLPDNGYDSKTVGLNNTGESSLNLTLESFEEDYLCIEGFDKGMQELGLLKADQSYSLIVGVCNYFPEEGERDTEIQGNIIITHNGKNSPLEIPWSFTPVLIID